MAVEIRVTPAGESVTQATFLRWLKPDGAAVKVGDALCELETDKANKEEYAQSDGVLHAQAKPGDKVAIGDLIGTIDPDGVPAAPPETTGTTGPAKAPAPAPAAPSRAEIEQPEVRASPAARVVMDTEGINPAKVTPS